MNTRSIRIGAREIGAGHPVYIVAELSANHNQQFERAAETIRAARDAGADAIKLQTYLPETLTIDCATEHFRVSGTLWEGRTLFDLYREAYTPWEWHEPLKRLADDIGLDFFSSPFDTTAVELLRNLDVIAYKIASFEIVDLELLRTVARTGRPVIMSTGMATLAEIDEAVRVLRQEGASDIALLKCTSSYPAPADQMNLRTIPHLADAFGLPVGLSDHTMDVAVPVASVALGASIIEKHFTLARADGGPDSAFSLEPREFAAMVAAVRQAESSLGRVHYGPTPFEERSLAFRRSLFVVADVPRGARFTRDNVRSIRPGHGLHPRYLPQVLGREAVTDIPRGTPVRWDLLGGEPQGDALQQP